MGFVVAVGVSMLLAGYLLARTNGNAGLAEQAVREAEAAKEALREERLERAAEQARTDSIHMARAQEIAAERARAEVRARAAEQRADALATRLRDSISEDARPLLDSLTTAHAQEVGELRAVIAGQDSLAASLRGQILTRDAVIAALHEELTASHRVSETWQARYEAERNRGWGKYAKGAAGGLAIAAGVRALIGG